MSVNPERLNEFLGRAVVDIGATLHAGLVLIGEKLGLYKTLAASGPLTPAELAQKTGTNERYVREWLNALARSLLAEIASNAALLQPALAAAQWDDLTKRAQDRVTAAAARLNIRSSQKKEKKDGAHRSRTNV